MDSVGGNMKIFVICSKQFYPKIASIKEILEDKGIEVFLPNSQKLKRKCEI